MMLNDKVAVIYGAGGAIGGAVARAFARDGVKLFLTGRASAPVQAVAAEIASAGGQAEAAEVDALDEKAIDEHLRTVTDKVGRVDISFNAIGLPDGELVGIPLVEMDVEAFSRPIASYTRSYFLTARLAARRLVAKKSGVIMTISALPARMGSPMVGGYTPALAAKEALTRSLSLELAPHGVRVINLRPHAIPETSSIRKIFNLKAAKLMTWDQWQEAQAARTHTRRLTELAQAAVFAACDRASGLTGTTLNLSMGVLDD
jgi:NAD(P)-dependent dehydrogenase (short-subunit alcohol dehydrogenase family)